ncbi:MAG: RNA polymerase sigma factor [Ferruginibacter sp.]
MNQPEIIHRLKNGDPSVFSDIVTHWQNMVYNTALSIVQNETDAEDITQDVFIEVYEKSEQFRGDALLSTWIYRITINKSLDLQRQKKRQKNGGLLQKVFAINEEDEPVNFDHPGVQLDNKEKAAMLFKALKKLPENQQVAFTLHKIEGLTYQEIAEVMQISLPAAEGLMVRAKAGLKNILEYYFSTLD